METLPDHLGTGLRVAIVGARVTGCAAARGHYYAGPGDGFWRLLHESGIVSHRLVPEQDADLPALGVGLTDLVKTPPQSRDRVLSHDLPAFEAKIDHEAPAWVAFHGKAAAKAYAAYAGHRSPPLGPAPWTVVGRPVFVLPSASGANRRASYDGRATRLEWWAELAALLGEVGAAATPTADPAAARSGRPLTPEHQRAEPSP